MRKRLAATPINAGDRIGGGGGFGAIFSSAEKYGAEKYRNVNW